MTMPLTTLTEYERALDLYAQEIGVDYLHIRKLIDSHRRLRKLSGDDRATRVAEHKAMQESAETKAYEYALANNYISLDKLRGMTLRGVLALLQEG